MNLRRLSALILGLWMGLTAAMMFVAIHNFRGVDRLLEGPAVNAGKMIEALGNDQARLLLRYQVSELNRFFFDTFGTVQLCLAIGLGACLFFAFKAHKLSLVLATALLIIVVFEHRFLTPEITYLGRQIDFVPVAMASPDRARFWSFHFTYSIAEVVKCLLLLGVGIKVLARSDMRRRVSENDNLVEETLELR